MVELCTKKEITIQDIKQGLDNYNRTWDLKADPRAIQGLRLIIEAAELQSDWGKFVSQMMLDSLTVKKGEESEWYIEIRLCKKEQNNDSL